MENMFEGAWTARGELHFSGVSGIGTQATAVGKIYIWRADTPNEPPDAAIICLFDEGSVACASSYMALSHPSAVVLSSRAVSARLLSFLICSKIPYIILNDSLSFSQSNACRVALLDTKRNLLIVNPQLQTLNMYSEKNTDNSLLPDVIVPNRKAVYSGTRESNALMYCVSCESAQPELFDALCALAEEGYSHNRDRHIAVNLPIPHGDKQSELFCEYAEALFCAAVYGSFSLVLSDFYAETQISHALSLLHSVFCRLQEQGREFNGYLKKGLMLESPLWLTASLPMQNPDMLFLDFDRLLPRLLGCELSELNSLQGTQLVPWQMLNIFSHRAPLYAKSSLPISCPLLQALSENTSVKDVFSPENMT